MKKYILILLLLLITNVVFAVKVGDVSGLFKPISLKVDEGDIFVSEESTCSIYVYSLEPLKLKYELGKKGEGPGEFKREPTIAQVSPDYILAFDQNKGIWFSRKGEMLKEKVLRNTYYRWISSSKDNYATLELFYDRQTGVGGWSLVLLDSQFERIKELTRVNDAVRITAPNQVRKHVNAFRPVVQIFTYEDKIFLGNSAKGFFFDVFDHQGNHLYSIDKNDQVEKIKIDDAYKNRVLDYIQIHNRAAYERHGRSKFRFTTHLPAFKGFQVDDNKIFVITYKEKDGLRELIVMDIKGKILDRLFLPLKSIKFHHGGGKDTYAIDKGVLYELVENEKTETWEIHKTVLTSAKK